MNGNFSVFVDGAVLLLFLLWSVQVNTLCVMRNRDRFRFISRKFVFCGVPLHHKYTQIAIVCMRQVDRYGKWDDFPGSFSSARNLCSRWDTGCFPDRCLRLKWHVDYRPSTWGKLFAFFPSISFQSLSQPNSTFFLEEKRRQMSNGELNVKSNSLRYTIELFSIALTRNINTDIGQCFAKISVHRNI